MSLKVRMRERFAKRAARFVEKRRAQLGCAKKAMTDIARAVGMSVTKLYRAMNGYGPVTIEAHHHAALLSLTLGTPKLAARFRRNAKSDRANQNSPTENFIQA